MMRKHLVWLGLSHRLRASCPIGARLSQACDVILASLVNGTGASCQQGVAMLKGPAVGGRRAGCPRVCVPVSRKEGGGHRAAVPPAAPPPHARPPPPRRWSTGAADQPRYAATGPGPPGWSPLRPHPSPPAPRPLATVPRPL